MLRKAEIFSMNESCPDPGGALPPQAQCDQVPAVALILPAAPGTLSVSSPLARSLLALIRLTAHAKNVQVGAEEMEKP